MYVLSRSFCLLFCEYFCWFKEINELLSGQLTDEDEAAVDEELAAILSEDMPQVPQQEPEIIVEEPEIIVEEPSPEQGKVNSYFCDKL